jgi:ABC-type transporter Mla MlaB component
VLPLTVDFTETRQLASAGVRALHQVRDQLAVHGHDLTIIAAPESSVAAVLDVVRLPHTTSAGTGVPPAAGAGAPDPGRT